MTPKQARATIARAYAFYHSRASLAPRTRADAAPRIIGAYRAFCHLTGPDRTEARKAIMHMIVMEQRHKDPAIQVWKDHVTMPHHLKIPWYVPKPGDIYPESVNVWLRLIEHWTPGRTDLDMRHYWRQAYRAHLDAQNC